ncbi:sulfotransferase domain-containing protein [bacterium]|nr:sulfotransferase domain-containing protein [bacterium]
MELSKNITIVSGLPRSGTSMMMKMLEAGGLETVTDEIRKADEDNPKGYYEFEKVKKIKEDSSWLGDMKGKVVKMVSMLLYDLPPDYSYKIIFMRREMNEILASQAKMLERKGKSKGKADDEVMGKYFTKHLNEVIEWLGSQDNVDVLYVKYNDMINDPINNAKAVTEFMDRCLDLEQMTGVVDKTLYRNRTA